MTDLQILVRQTSNPSILKMQQRLHGEVVELGKLAMQWKEGAHALQLALETEREAANLYAKQVAHWIGKYDALLKQQPEPGVKMVPIRQLFDHEGNQVCNLGHETCHFYVLPKSGGLCGASCNHCQRGIPDNKPHRLCPVLRKESSQ